MTYQPDEDDIPAHRYDQKDLTYFSLGTNYGTGKPHFHVTLDENGGERSWWLDPEHAVALGRRLVSWGEDCLRRNDDEEARRARWQEEHSDG